MMLHSVPSTQHLSSDVEHHAYLPATACLLEFVQMFRDPFYIGVEFLCLLIHWRADQMGSQQPDVTFPRQGEWRLLEDHPCGIFPIDHLRQPIE